MARFLDFVVMETLHGNAAQLKEMVIGVSVFDRDATYDPRTDPIVRVEARRLRSKLTGYYETIGQEDEVIIALGRGTYAPVFRRRSEAPPRRVKPPPQSANAIAVVPFRNLHHEDDHDHFADGLFEELISALMRIPGMRVIAWNSDWPVARQESGSYVSETTVNLRYILRGSIRKRGERMRVAAQLIDGSNREYLWSDTYDGHMQDPFEIQERIANSIARSVEERLFAPPCCLPDAAEEEDTERAPGTR
jgi:serine/threonine-protein kinase